MPNEVGKTLGRYQILQKVGHGGMSDVWLCEDPRLRRKVAAKTLPAHDQGDREYVARFIREARAAGALNHAHILPIHDYGEQQQPDGSVITYIVMPYITGGSLADRIDRLGSGHVRLPQQEVITYLAQAAEAIDYAHSRGIIHRDIKPANMLLRDDNWLLLADFGIARMLSDDDHLTHTGTSIGTPDYMAPEQAQGRAEFASDTYSLAVIAYQLLSGSLPFTADSSYAITIQHLTTPAPSPRRFNPRLTQGCEAVLLRALAKEPKERFPSAEAFVAALRQSLVITDEEDTYVDPENIATQGPPTGPKRTETTHIIDVGNAGAKAVTTVTRRNVLIGSGVAAVVVVGAAVLGYNEHLFAFQTNKPASTPQPVSHATPKANPNSPVAILREHNDHVTSLAWSPKDNVLASAADDNFVKLWNFTGFKPYTSLKSSATQSFPYESDRILAWSPDGNMLAIANAYTEADFNNNHIQVYKKDLSGPVTGFTKPLQVSSTVNGLDWIQEGKYLEATFLPLTSKNTQMVLWDMTQPETQFQATSLPNLLETDTYNNDISACAIASPDTTTIALGLYTTPKSIAIGQPVLVGNSVQWQSRGANLKFGTNDFFDIVALTWSPDGKFIAAIDSGTPTTVYCWGVSDGKAQSGAFKISGQTTQLTAIAWCPVAGSTLLAAACLNGPVYIWNKSKGPDPIRALDNANIADRAPVLAWSSDGQWLAAGYQDTNDSILVWHL